MHNPRRVVAQQGTLRPDLPLRYARIVARRASTSSMIGSGTASRGRPLRAARSRLSALHQPPISGTVPPWQQGELTRRSGSSYRQPVLATSSTSRARERTGSSSSGCRFLRLPRGRAERSAGSHRPQSPAPSTFLGRTAAADTGAMTLLDTNVLIYASAEGAEHHEWALGALADAVSADGAAVSAVKVAEICVGADHAATEVERIRDWGVAVVDVPAAAAEVCAVAYLGIASNGGRSPDSGHRRLRYPTFSSARTPRS